MKIKKQDKSKVIEYDGENNKIEIQYKIEQEGSKTQLESKINVKNEHIKDLELQIEQTLEENSEIIIENSFDTKNNILLNDIDITTMNNTLNSLIKRIQKDVQTKNGELSLELVNVLYKELNVIQKDFEELRKKSIQVFNNNFLEYKGNNISKDLLYNMIDYAGKNMSGYQLFSGGAIKIYLEEGKDNTNMSEEIKTKIKDAKGNYSINFQYNSESKISVILIQPVIKK